MTTLPRIVVETLHATSLLVCLATAAVAAPLPEAADRAPDYATALERAKLTGRDIVVFQHGSDWNRLGERLLAEVWNQPAFTRAVGTNAILVAVDQPEAIGNPPVAGAVDGRTEASYETPVTPVQHLRDLATNVPPNDIQSVETTNGTVFARDTNGTYRAAGPNPASETISLRVKASVASRLIRLDFPLHESLPGRGPGRASNGNFAISEIEIADAAGAARPVRSAWANASEAHWGAWMAVDGIADQPDNVWNAHGHLHQPRTLLLLLEQPVAAGGEIVVRLRCQAQWGQHVPGTLRAAVIPEATAAEAVERVAAAEVRHARNARFTWRGDDVPRIAYLDREGRPVTSEDQPRLGLTPASLAVRVQQMRALRERRDALWAKADTLSGSAQADLLRQSLDLLGLGGSPGHDKCYQFIHERMRKADPDDLGGNLRWLEFQPDPRHLPAFVQPALKLAGEKKYAEAIALLDTELASPRNRPLTTDHRQRILMAKHNVYQQWPEHDAQRLDVLREIAALDGETYLGIGAAGYLAMFHKNPTPFALNYGWATNHVRAGLNTWTFGAGTTNHFDHAGRYTLRIVHNGGKGTLTIRRAALVAGGQTLSESAPAAALKPGDKIELPLELPAWPPPGPLALRVEADAAEGQTDVAGRFEVDPLLPL
jgi:hypothetical protein